MARRPPCTPELPPALPPGLLPSRASRSPRPKGAVGDLYLAPGAEPYRPLTKWSRGRQQAEIARIDRRLAELAAVPDPRRAGGLASGTEPGTAPGPFTRLAVAYGIEIKALRKYRQRLARALGRRAGTRR